MTMTAEIAPLEQQGTTLARTVAGLHVVDTATFEQAGKYSKSIAAYIKRVGEVLDPIVSSAHAAHQVALRQRAALLAPAEAAKRMLGQRMAAYEQEAARQRREIEAAAARERERLEAEERARVAAEQRRLQAEAEERQLAAAVAAEQAGDAVLAERIVAEAPVIAPPAPRPVFLPSVAAPTTPRVEGVSFRDNWKAEVTDLLALVRAVAAGSQPLALVEPNMTGLNGLARSLKDALAIPGVRAKNERTTATRTA